MRGEILRWEDSDHQGPVMWKTFPCHPWRDIFSPIHAPWYPNNYIKYTPEICNFLLRCGFDCIIIDTAGTLTRIRQEIIEPWRLISYKDVIFPMAVLSPQWDFLHRSYNMLLLNEGTGGSNLIGRYETTSTRGLYASLKWWHSMSSQITNYSNVCSRDCLG